MKYAAFAARAVIRRLISGKSFSAHILQKEVSNPPTVTSKMNFKNANYKRTRRLLAAFERLLWALYSRFAGMEECPPAIPPARAKVKTRAVVLKPLPSPKPGHRGRVLVVEDNRMTQKMLQRLLDRAGYRVSIAENGLEALEASSRERFDIILMDIEMPVMGGREAARLIRSRDEAAKNSVPIIGVIAFISEEQRRECLEIGIDSFVSKPFDGANVLGQIDEVLKKQRMNRFQSEQPKVARTGSGR